MAAGDVLHTTLSEGGVDAVGLADCADEVDGVKVTLSEGNDDSDGAGVEDMVP